ncbi:MAG: ABC transporter substrate-binding protein [Xanthobacteraceae bacterium]|nr:ABC transporter substrate-binding protein [Xanthobacteraceae bacterium]
MSGITQAQEKLKIGVLSTMSGPGGVMGRHHRDGAVLALEQLNGKLGGVDAELVFGDDQQKPDIGRQVVEGMLKRDNVKFVTGVVFSNVLLAIYDPVITSGAILVSASGGPSEVAGKICSPNFFSTSWQNDQAPEAMGKYMTDQNIGSVAILAPNYTAGKDMLAGFKRNYKGKIVAEIYTNFTQADYQSELSQLRAAKPDAVFVFYPGGLGIQFVKQYSQAGLQKQIPLYSVYTQNETTLGAIGEAAEGNFEAGFWSPDLKNATNEAFVAAFRKRFNYTPSEYAAASYDAIRLIDSGLRQTKGNTSDTNAVIAAMKKADFQSVRGQFKFNTNHFPIQDYYLFKLTKSGEGNTFYRKQESLILKGHGDFYATNCAMK